MSSCEASIVPENRRFRKGGRRLEHDGVVTEQHSQLADRPIEVDAELVCQAQYLPVADVEVHRRVAGVVAKNLADLMNFQLVERRRRHLAAAATPPTRCRDPR